jgi:uncharacterized phage protein gp47/JayE
MPTYPLATLAASVTAAGITAPNFQDIIASLNASAQSIFGEDIYITPDTQDGQIISVFAAAINDSNAATIATYNGYSPAGAVGAQLSSNVKNNGLRRQAGSNSTVELVIGGVAGTSLISAIAQDANGNLWDIPFTVIPPAGVITVTAVAEQEGTVSALPGTVNKRYTQILGWQTVTNPAAAAPGSNTESDAALRRRQAASTTLPSLTPLQSIAAGVGQVTGVSRSTVYENPTNVTDANGVPAHSISAVVLGGDVTAVAQVIEQRKSPGTGTYGTTSVVVTDPAGVPIQINFFELALTTVYVNVSIQALPGYVDSTGVALRQAITDFINGLAIGQDLYYDWLFGPAALYGSGLEFTYRITDITVGTAPSPTGRGDIAIAFNAAANTVIANVGLTVS